GPEIQSPQWEEVPAAAGTGISLAPHPVYPAGQGLSQAQLRRWIHWVLDHRPPAETLSEATRPRRGLIGPPEAFDQLHRPDSPAAGRPRGTGLEPGAAQAVDPLGPRQPPARGTAVRGDSPPPGPHRPGRGV